VTPRRWLVGAACVTVLVYAVAGGAAYALGLRARTRTRVPSDAVTGSAAKAAGDSGVFATPVMSSNVRPVIAHADAESAAVAMSYRLAPSYQVIGIPYYKERPTERRHFCGRTYYVRPVVALPDAADVPSVTSNPLMIWGPAWVIPVCNDAGFVQTTVLLTDAPVQLRVILGDQPSDVPEMVFPDSTFPRITGWDARYFPDWERGIGISPESAVAVAVAWLAGTGARVSEIPEAFMLVLPHELPRATTDPTMVQTHLCPRWRLTLDRPVSLRGMTSGQLVRTRTVFILAGETGCGGAATLQIPRPTQPATLPFQYGVRLVTSNRSGEPAPPEMRSTALRVTEPIWFEEARTHR
jgi:hypothetical protein